MDLAELEKRLIRMEDIEAIKQLKALYCEICDDDHNPDRITTIFVEDGIWEAGDFGKGQGHAAIRELFQGFQKMISFSQHMVMNPIIKVDGDRATGTWYFLGPFTFGKSDGKVAGCAIRRRLRQSERRMEIPALAGTRTHGHRLRNQLGEARVSNE